MSAPPANKKAKTDGGSPPPARIALIGAAWWSQGWHLPQLERNPDSTIAAIMQRSEQPKAAAFLNLTLETKTQLAARYPDAPIFSSCEELLANEETMAKIDGVIICTAHACHADMGAKFLAAGKHVLMEKPMTVDVAEARTLASQAAAAAPQLAFMVNNTANYRDQVTHQEPQTTSLPPSCFVSFFASQSVAVLAKAFEARKLVEDGELGDIHHVLCVMYSPLMFLFDDPANDGWVKPTVGAIAPPRLLSPSPTRSTSTVLALTLPIVLAPPCRGRWSNLTARAMALAGANPAMPSHGS